jgi:hypothetical protein
MEEWRTVTEWDTFCASYLVIFLGINLLVSKEARDQMGRPGQTGKGCSATLLEVQQLCTDLYTVGDQQVRSRRGPCRARACACLRARSDAVSRAPL